MKIKYIIALFNLIKTYLLFLILQKYNFSHFNFFVMHNKYQPCIGYWQMSLFVYIFIYALIYLVFFLFFVFYYIIFIWKWCQYSASEKSS